MKRTVLLLLTISGFLNAFAQDKILDTNGNEHTAIVTEISPDSVYYREIADTLTQKVNSMSKDLVFMITFKNGAKEVYTNKEPLTPAPLSSENYYLLGQQYAKANFKASGVFWSTFALTSVPFFGPAASFYVGPAISFIPVSKGNITASRPEYLQNEDYLDGYRRQARKKKFGSAAAGFGLGLIPYTVLTLGLMVAMLNH